MHSEIKDIFVGAPREIFPGKPLSAIDKHSLDEPVFLNSLGLEFDEQADLSVHGGADKALHLYPTENYRYWNNSGFFPGNHFQVGGFGENISAERLPENDVMIGDVFQIGSAKIQVTQGRTPCWKLNQFTKTSNLAYHFLKSGRTGYYFKVLTEGIISKGDGIRLIDRFTEKYSVKEVTRHRYDKSLSPDTAKDLSNLPGLSVNWKRYFSQGVDGRKFVEPSKAWSPPA